MSFSAIKTKIGSGLKPILPAPLLLLALVVSLWAFSLQAFKLNDMQDWGLLSIFPASIIAAYILLLMGFASLYFREHVSDAVFACYILLLILMIHGTPQLLYGTLRYSWAWKHVGIVDYIIRFGRVDPQIAILPVYHNWPGFFALNALFTQLAGYPSALTYAGWGPVFFEILFAFGALALFRLFTQDRRLQWLGVWFFLLTNWVGQDYFSPQATTYFMMFCFLILILQGFGPKQPLSLISWKSRLASSRPLARFVEWISSLKLPLIPLPEPALTKFSQRMLGAMVLLMFGVIVSIHQLTPFMGVIATIVLILFGFIRWRTLPLWMIAIILLWLAFPAQAYNKTVEGSILESFGKIEQTVNSGLVDVATISIGQAAVSWMGRGLSALILLLAGVGVFQRARKGYLDLPVILLAISPVIVLFLNSYGGEALFRVYLFMIPYLAFLAAGAIIPREETIRSWLQPIAIGILSVIMLTAFLFAYYGKERQYSFTKGEVEAAEYLYSHAVPNSLLVEGSRNYPTMFSNYEYFTYVAIDREPADSINRLLANPVDVLDEWLSDTTRYKTSYLFITRSQKIDVDEVGGLPVGSLDKIQNLLEKSGKFEVVFSNQDAIIFAVRKSIK
jgi:hypothetical protein